MSARLEEAQERRIIQVSTVHVGKHLETAKMSLLQLSNRHVNIPQGNIAQGRESFICDRPHLPKHSLLLS
jgi:hypothetical protein